VEVEVEVDVKVDRKWKLVLGTLKKAGLIYGEGQGITTEDEAC
jgi:hypothetical protein